MSLIPSHTNDPICPLCELKLKDAHPILVDWFVKLIKRVHPDAHISWSYRDEVNQDQCFAEGKSKLRWPDSPHNKRDPVLLTPRSEALDLFQLDEQGQAKWPPGWFKQIADETVISGDQIFWGGHFKTIHDADHYQIQTV